MADGAGRGMPLIVTSDMTGLRAFYTELLAFEEVTWKEGTDGGGFAVFAYGTCKLGYATPDALPELPGPASNAVAVFEVPELEPVHRVMSTRAGDAVGPLRAVDWGGYFDVRDPRGATLRFIEVTAD
jgi:catechol 2,3-dioxygenase-like lactoylglutathione lyase family enzyme